VTLSPERSPKEFALATSFSLWHRNDYSPAADLVARLTGRAGRARLAAEGIVPPDPR
jgi:hypothetical protein